MAHAVEFEYRIGDRVVILGCDRAPGHVSGLCARVWGITYCVTWWHDGRRCDEWLHDWEIEADDH